MKYITVFCSARDLDKKYTVPAEKFGRLLVKNGYGLVWGGTDRGLMKVLADAVTKERGKLIGVTIPYFADYAREGCQKMIVAKTLGKRKAMMLSLGEAVVGLIGGLGTMDEITDIMEMKRIEEHHKPIVLLNTENFYEGLRVQLQKMKDDGFLHVPLENIVYFADEPEEVIEYLNQCLSK